MAVTRSDVARAAGVSPAVVSYVLNGGPRPVSAAARSRVEAAIDELDYRPNAIASALRGGSTHSVGMLSPDPLDPYFAELSEAMEREFSSAGYVVLTGHTRGDKTREERYDIGRTPGRGCTGASAQPLPGPMALGRRVSCARGRLARVLACGADNRRYRVEPV